MKTVLIIIALWLAASATFCFWCYRIKRRDREEEAAIDYEQEWLVQKLDEAYAAKEARRKGK